MARRGDRVLETGQVLGNKLYNKLPKFPPVLANQCFYASVSWLLAPLVSLPVRNLCAINSQEEARAPSVEQLTPENPLCVSSLCLSHIILDWSIVDLISQIYIYPGSLSWPSSVLKMCRWYLGEIKPCSKNQGALKLMLVLVPLHRALISSVRILGS